MKAPHSLYILVAITFRATLCQDSCNKPLGLEDERIKDAQFTALTAYDENIKVYGPQRARLNLLKWPQGYRGNPKSQENSWVSVDFGRGVVITGIATQGYGERGIQEWVSMFMLMYSTQEDDNEKTLAPADRSSEWLFQGNYDASTVVRQSILRPVIASRVKLIPIEWHTNVGLRMELFGCDADYYMDAWLLYRDTSFRMAYSLPSSNEYQTMANSTEKLLSNYFDVNYVTGYLKTKFMEFSPQTSTSGLTNLAAKIRFYCLRPSRETLMRELNIFVSAPDSTFENEVNKLRFSKLDCKPPKINIKPSVDTPKIVGVIRRSFPVFTVSIRQDCPSNDNLLIYWQVATLANSRKVLSPLSPPQHLNINKFLLLPEMYPTVDTLYIRCVALLQGFQWTFSMDDRFIKLIDADVVAKLQGPSIAIRGISDIELDASHSYLTTSSEWAKRVILTYSWYCFGPVMDKRIDQADKVKCSPKGERLGIATEALHINASDLVEGNYAFQMIVEADGVTSVAVQNVTVYGFQGLSIRCQSNCGRKINSQITGILEAECRGSVCSLQRRYLWSAVYTASGKWREVNLTNDPYSSRISLTNLPEILNTSTNIDKPFIIKVRAFFGDSAQITSTADFILNSVPATDYTGEAGCFVNVRQGYAMKTKFQISCERWQDEDMPLSYKFQYLSEFGNIILQSGYLANASAELLPGNATLDYMVDIECVVVDSLGASATVKLPVKVLPPSESEAKSLLKNIKNTLTDLIESGDQDKAADMSLFSLSVMKTRNNSAKEEAEIKANILDEMADIVVQTLPQVTKFAVLGAETTHQDWPMSNKTKKNALNLITKTANTLKNFTSEGNMGIDADLVKNVAEIFIDGVSNVLLSAIPDNEVDISHKCASVSQTIARTFATLKAVGIGSVSITSKAITINVNRDTPLAFDRVSTRTGGSTLMLPPSVTLFPNTSATPPSIDLQVIKFVANPFFGDPSQVSVNSEVLDVSLYVESFGELKVKNLQPPINLFIPLKRKHQNESKMQSPSHFVKPTLNASNTMNMTFHRIFITSEYVNLTVTLKPEAGSYVDVFVKPAVRPSYDQYVFKTIIPDLNACLDSKLSPWDAVDGCKRDPFSFDINSKITGAKGLHFIGVRFQPLKGKESSDTELSGMPNLDESSHDARIVRRNNQIEFSCKSSNGRQKRACVGVKDPPPTPPRPTQVFYPVYDSTTDVNYTLQIYMASCVYWDHARGTWSSDGCTIGKQSNTSHVHCLCNHLTPFGGDFLIAPNPIDFDKVLMEFSRLGETGNVLVLVMVCVLWAVYLLGLMAARKADVNDISKELCSTLINSEDSSSAAYYKITIFTGVWKGCGTTSSVGMTLYGDRDNSRPFYFNNSTKGPSFFSRGSVTSFIVKCRTLGNIFRVELWHDNSGPSPSWFIDRIEIAEEHSGKYWYFLARRWLAVHKEGIHVTLPVSDISDLRKFKNIFYSRASKQFCDAHLWLSLFTRTTQSPFTRCQRLACCFLIVFGSMVVNAMFYQFGKQTDDDFHVGPVRVSLSGIKIGVQSALMLLPVTTLVVIIFKNIKQQRITLSLGDPEALEKITVGCLPAGATWIAWLICLSGSAASSVFTVFYSLVWGAEISNQWLISTMVSFVEDIFFIQPVKLIILSCLLAWIIKPDLGKEKDSFTSHCVLLRHEEVSLPAARKLKKCRERKVKRRWLTTTTIEIAAFLFFVSLVFVVCYGRRDSRMFTMTESVKGHFPEFQEVEGPSSFWKWTSDVLLPALYDKKQNAALDEGFIGNGKLFLVGMPRIRQLRVVSNLDCFSGTDPLLSRTLPRCLPDYSISSEDRSPYSLPGWIPILNNSSNHTKQEISHMCPIPWRYQTGDKLQSMELFTSEISYSGGGFVADLGYDSKTASRIIKTLKELNWIDRKTAGILVEFALFDPSSSLFSAQKFILQRFPSSGSVGVRRLDTISVYHPTNDAFYVFTQVCQLLLIMLILLYIAAEFISLYRQGLGYFRRFWSWVDLLQVLGVLAALVMFYAKEWYVGNFVRRIRHNPYETSSMDYIVFWNEIENTLLSIVIYLMTLKMLRIIRFNLHIYLLTNTLEHAVRFVFSFFVMFVVIVIGCSLMASLAFGEDQQDFSSLPRSIATCLTLIVAPNDSKESDRVIAPLFLIVYSVSVYVLLINLLMAILNESFSRAKSLLNPKEIPEVSYAQHYVKKLKANIGNLFKSKQTNKKMSIGLKSLNGMKTSSDRREEEPLLMESERHQITAKLRKYQDDSRKLDPAIGNLLEQFMDFDSTALHSSIERIMDLEECDYAHLEEIGNSLQVISDILKFSISRDDLASQ